MQAVGWRSIFWINLPVGLAALVLAAKFVPESNAPRARAFDPVGQALVFAGLISLTYAVIEGPHAGWTCSLILGLFATSVTALVIFLIYMNRAAKSLWWTCVSFEAYLSAAQQFWAPLPPSPTFCS
jgi:hypothetical protein